MQSDCTRGLPPLIPSGLRLTQSDATSSACADATLNLLIWSEIVNLYRLTLPDEPPEQLKPNYNVPPTTVMPIIRPAGNGRELVMAGLGVGAVLAEARAA
jgi:hypothetical protein